MADGPRALFIGEPFPESAALLDELEDAEREYGGWIGINSAKPIERCRAARAAVDAHLVSLCARLTAAERREQEQPDQG